MESGSEAAEVSPDLFASDRADDAKDTAGYCNNWRQWHRYRSQQANDQRFNQGRIMIILMPFPLYFVDDKRQYTSDADSEGEERFKTGHFSAKDH